MLPARELRECGAVKGRLVAWENGVDGVSGMGAEVVED